MGPHSSGRLLQNQNQTREILFLFFETRSHVDETGLTFWLRKIFDFQFSLCLYSSVLRLQAYAVTFGNHTFERATWDI